MRDLKIVAVALMLVCTSKSMAQRLGKVSGTVSDQRKQVIASATVALLTADDSMEVKSVLSDANGKFVIDVTDKGQYFLSYSVVGFEKGFSTIFSVEVGQFVGVKPIFLLPIVSKLQEVTITSKKPMIEVTADKTVFNVESSINATGSNALELLQKSPGVQVDNNENISMKGKGGVRIYVDGKMMQLDNRELAAYLRSITSSDIEAIEMISNPGAKFDASGNAGIVNIRLKKSKKFGTNGNADLGIVQAVTPKANGSIGLNYRNKKVNLFSNLGANMGDYQNTMQLYRLQRDTVYDQRNISLNAKKSINIKAGADFFFNAQQTVGIMVSANNNQTAGNSSSSTPIYLQSNHQFVKRLVASNESAAERTNAKFNLNYRYVDTSGREINIDADYGLFRAAANSYQPNYYYGSNNNLIYSVINHNNAPVNIDIYTAKMDVEQKLGKGKLGYGVKTSFVNTSNTFEFFNDDINGVPIKIAARSNGFIYKENIQAAYLNYQQMFSEKWSLQAGLRAEQTGSKGILTRADAVLQNDNRVERSYTNLFPSGAVTWYVDKKNAFNVTFSKRIDRPTYQDLNPFEVKLDELTYSKGNAFLRPQYTNTIELTHTYLGFINTTAGYSYVKDYATQVTDTIGNATFVQEQNLATQQILSGSIGSTLPIKKWWNGYLNIWYNSQLIKGMIGVNEVNRRVQSFGAYLQQSFTLGKGYTAELSGAFNGPSVWGVTWKTKSQGGLDLGFQKTILQKKASVKIAVTDIFKTNPWTAISDFGGAYIRGSGAWESRTLRISASWHFGSKEIKNARDRKTGLETEAKRIK